MNRRSLFAILLVASLLLSVGGAAVVADKPSPPSTPPPTETPTGTWELAPGVIGDVAQELPILPGPPGQGDGTEPLSVEPMASPIPPWYITLPVPAYSQRDARWSGQVMQTCAETIGASGCLLTSATMVFGYYGSSKTPLGENTCMGVKACPWDWAYGAVNCSENKASWSDANFLSPTDANLTWAITHGYPAILHLTLTSDPSKHHYVVVNRIAGYGTSDSDFYIVDPYDGLAKPLTAYTNNGRTKVGIAFYTRR